jgi:DNA-binding LytR/AlgR family response regulator
MDVVIVEDEAPAAERLKFLLHQHDPSIKVCACLDSITETVSYLKTRSHPDLLLLDIHLADGHSFEIFNRVQYKRPVIFITAYDQYALDAFRVMSIDYILKPVSRDALTGAFGKLKNLTTDIFPGRYSDLSTAVATSGKYKSNFLVKVGQRHFFVNTEDVAYFRADNKVVFLADKTGHRFIVDYTLERVQEMVNPQNFFRTNRRFIINRSSIGEIKPYFNSRMLVTLKHNSESEPIIISRDRVADFKNWIKL